MKIKLVEVGPRDGLQNEPKTWSVADRIAFIDLLSQCQFDEIEVGSFVSPKWVPQMAHTDKVFQNIEKRPGILYSCLVPNSIGFAAAQAVGVQNISIFTAASETFNQKNINCCIEESFNRFLPMMQGAKMDQIRVRGYISCVVECPYEGPIAPEQVALLAVRLLAVGCAEISLGDTIGKGTPESIKALIKAVSKVVPVEQLAIHCHDTYGNALENILAAMDCGVQVIDSAMGGLGGCPYAGGKAKGNVATETVVKALHQRGYLDGFNFEALQQASMFVAARR